MSQAEREKIELSLGLGTVGKQHAVPLESWGPSAWRKTLKYWAALVLGIILGAVGGGVLAVVVGVAR